MATDEDAAESPAEAPAEAENCPACAAREQAAAGKGKGQRKPQGAQTCDCRYKHTPRSEELQADLQRRLNRIIGQLNGVKSMIDDNRYCGDVLTQLAAAQSALQSVSQLMLKNHLETCVVERIEQGDLEVIDEVMRLFKKFK